MNGGLGLGIELNAKNLAGPAVTQLTGQLGGLKNAANQAGQAMDAFQDKQGRWRDSKGKFLTGEQKAAMGLPAGGGGGGGGAGGGFGVGGFGNPMRNLDLHMAQQQVAGLGASIQGLGKGGLAALDPAIDASKEFSFAIARVRTEIEESDYSTQDLRKTTMALADTYGGDAAKQANALYDVIGAGVTDAAKATDLLTVANRFAVGGTAELNDAVDVLTSAVNTYTDKNLTAQQASDLMFQAIAAGKQTATELSRSLGEVAPTAHAAGVSFQELQAAIAAMTVQGIKTPQAATALNAMLQNIQKPAKDAEVEARRLGISFSATALKSKGLAGVLGQLKGNTKINDETFVKLFGSIDGVKGALALTSNGGAKFAEVLGEMEHSAGATDKAFETMNDTSTQQENRLKAMGKNALILIGQGLEPMGASVMRVGRTVLEWFNRIPAPIRDFGVRVFSVAMALTMFLGVVVSAGAALGGLILAISAIGGTTLAALLPIIAVLAGIAGAVVLVVVGIKTAIDQNLGGAATRFQNFAKDVRLAWQGLGELFQHGGISSGSALFEAKNAELLNFVTNVYSMAMRLGHFFSSIRDGFNSVLATMGPTWDRLSRDFSKLGQSLGLTTSSADGAASSWKTFGNTGQTVGQIAGKAFDFMMRSIAAATEVFNGFMKQWDGIKTAISPVADHIARLGDQILALGADMGLVDPTKNVGGWEKFGEVIGTGVRIAALGIAGLIDTFADNYVALVMFVAMTKAQLTGPFALAWYAARQQVSLMLQAVVATAAGTLTAMARIIDGAAKVAGMPQVAEKGLESMVASVKDLAPKPEEAPTSVAVQTEEAKARAENDVRSWRSTAGGLRDMALSDIVANIGNTAAGASSAAATEIVNHIIVQVDGEKIAEVTEKGTGRETNPKRR